MNELGLGLIHVWWEIIFPPCTHEVKHTLPAFHGPVARGILVPYIAPINGVTCPPCCTEHFALCLKRITCSELILASLSVMTKHVAQPQYLKTLCVWNESYIWTNIFVGCCGLVNFSERSSTKHNPVLLCGANNHLQERPHIDAFYFPE